VDGFDRGNSPFEYTGEDIRGKKIAFTTTNGTQAIDKSKKAKHLLIGSFLNVSAVAQRVEELNESVLVVCAGWKGRFNLEDTLFAGALIDRLKNTFKSDDDAALAAVSLYTETKQDLVSFLNKSSHIQRLNRLNIHEDMAFCVQEDTYSVVPYLEGDFLFI
jgi:2-phosphosulfolactate phosphatase